MQAQHIGAILGELTRHRGRYLRVIAQGKNFPANLPVGNNVTPALGLRDLVGIFVEPVLGTVFLDHPQPGLIDELEEAGRRRSPCFCIGIQAGFTGRSLHQIVEISAGTGACAFNGVSHCRNARCRFFDHRKAPIAGNFADSVPA
jgi:hypothetical protein